jgi:ABC-type lipoprotein release transport system permease subunit
LEGIVGIVAVAVLVIVGVKFMNGREDQKADNGNNNSPNIVINVPGSYVENSSDKGTEKETVKTPISTQHSVRGNYYNIFIQENDVTDNCGTVYDKANVAVVGINSVAKKLTYNLDGSYTSLKGTIALSEEDKDRINFFQVYVYNEDGDCFYQSKQINEKSPDPIEINCGISGMSRITIELEGCTTTCGTIKVIMPDEGFVFEGDKE